MTRLVLHIGVHRTGTTSIQRFLHANRRHLLKRGIRYALDMEKHTDLGWQLEFDRLAPAEFIEMLVQDARQSACDVLVVSGEDFSLYRNPAALAPLLEHFDVRVLCYLRRQDLWLESWYNQHVRWPWIKELSVSTPAEFLARRAEFYWIDYAQMLQRWADAFGPERLAVRVFERTQLEGDLLADFGAGTGLDLSGLRMPEHLQNASCPPQAAEMLRHLKLLDKQGKHRLLIINAVVRAFAEYGLDTVRHIYSAAARQDLLDAYADSNARVARHYLGRPDGILFREKIDLDSPQSNDISLPEAGFLVDSIGRSMVAHLLARHAALDRKIRKAEAGGAGAAARFRYYLGNPMRLLRLMFDSKLGSLTVGHLLLDHQVMAFAQRLGLAQYSGRQRRQLIATLETLSREVRPKMPLPPAGAPEQPDPADVCTYWLEPMLDRLAASAADKSRRAQAARAKSRG